MMCPFVSDLAIEGVRVSSSCRVLGFTPQAFYKWRALTGSDLIAPLRQTAVSCGMRAASATRVR